MSFFKKALLVRVLYNTDMNVHVFNACVTQISVFPYCSVMLCNGVFTYFMYSLMNYEMTSNKKVRKVASKITWHGHALTGA